MTDPIKNLSRVVLAVVLVGACFLPAVAQQKVILTENTAIIVDGPEKTLLPADSIVIQNDKQTPTEALPPGASGDYVLKSDGTIDLPASMRLRRQASPAAQQDTEIVVFPEPRDEPKATQKGEFPAIPVTVYKRVKVFANGSSDAKHHELASRSGRVHVVSFYTKVASQVDIAPIILKYATKYNLDPYLVKAVIHTESRFRPQATSGVGAAGLMQLMPQTGRLMGARNLYDMDENIAAGTRYLRLMLDMFGKVEMAVAAYNAGPGTVRACHGIPHIYETQQYVVKVLSAYKTFKKATDDDE